MHCYTKDNLGLYVAVNPELVAFACLKNSNDLLGCSDRDMIWAREAAHIMQNDAMVMRSSESHSFIEKPMINGRMFPRRSFKSPLIGHGAKVIGVVGMSVPISAASLIPLTPQQNACLQQLALGYSHKKIAQILGLATKTVEHYLEAVKIRLTCQSRADLILQAVERGLLNTVKTP